MKINTLTRQIIAEYGHEGITAQNVIDFIIDTPINIVAVIRGEGTKHLSVGIELPVARLAQALNAILIHHFDSVQEFYDTFGLNRFLYDDLWSGNVKLKQLRRSLITNVVKTYNINPLYIYGKADTTVDMYLIKKAI